MLTVMGSWSNARIEPYPESMSMAGWQYECPAASAKARDNHRAVPQGVTLGEVRRGWKGKCD